jgi:hypothetical protein
VSGGTAAAASLALVAGLAGSIQVAVMGRFGDRIGSFEALAANLIFSSLVATAVLLVLRHSLAASATRCARLVVLGRWRRGASRRPHHHRRHTTDRQPHDRPAEASSPWVS